MAATIGSTPAPAARAPRDELARLLGASSRRTAPLSELSAGWIDTPIGDMLAIAADDGLHLLEFAERRGLPRELERLQARCGPARLGSHPQLERVAAALARYFDGAPIGRGLPLVLAGSAFQRGVWAELQRIPPGETRSYTALAQAVGRPDAVRAVARANGANQLAIVVPCHRIVGSDGAMVGYGGQIWRKQWLLAHERRFA